MTGRGRSRLLLSTSVAALLIGGGAPAAFAACVSVGASFSNAGTISCITISSTAFTGM